MRRFSRAVNSEDRFSRAGRRKLGMPAFSLFSLKAFHHLPPSPAKSARVAALDGMGMASSGKRGGGILLTLLLSSPKCADVIDCDDLMAAFPLAKCNFRSGERAKKEGEWEGGRFCDNVFTPRLPTRAHRSREKSWRRAKMTPPFIVTKKSPRPPKGSSFSS